MAIRVVCPNGHELNVKSSFAGKKGLCPHCKAVVLVPKPPGEDDFESSVLDMVGPPEEKPSELAESEIGHAARSAGTKPPLPPKKTCPKCHLEVAAGVRICSHCHTYIGRLSDF